MEAIQFLLAPFVMCLLLIIIHCYLGLHVLARGVVFIDLSLAQIASFGATLALLWDPEHQSSLGYFMALGATLVASAVFALARRFEKKIPQEALIGITYAFASAAVVLVIDRLSHGAEHLKEALVGQILWVGWSDVLKTLAIYSGVGLVHWLFKEKFIRNSFEGRQGHWFWDFLFYALLGVVITSSTSIAGVLLVFSFLIVPAVLSSLFAQTIGKRLVIGWSIGTTVNLIGMAVSYKYDLPVGAVLVVLMTSLPILSIPVLFLKSTR